MTMQVDLNCDMGESFGAYTIGADEAVFPFITSANVACGYHGGDPAVMRTTIARARERGVAIGYKDAEGWATEGWWNIASHTCETLLKGVLIGRFYYIHAVDYDRGGEWAGSLFMCTDDKSFTIRDTKDCVKRGYKKTGFFEVDTGEERDWTIRLTDPEGEAKSQ